jgi:hypothetical protein
MSSIRENIDFDGDNNLSGKDIDVLWAYIQTKALAEQEWADNIAKAPTVASAVGGTGADANDLDECNMCNDNPVKCSPVDPSTGVVTPKMVCGDPANVSGTGWRLDESFTGNGDFECPPCCTFIPTNFIEQMLDQYELNQTNGIAEDNSQGSTVEIEDQVSRYAGTLELGKPKGEPQPKIYKRWTLNDLPEITQVGGSDQDATVAMESFSGELNATLNNCTWTQSGDASTKFYVNLTDKDTSYVEFDDAGIINSKSSWTLHFKAKVDHKRMGYNPDKNKYTWRTLISKGNTAIKFNPNGKIATIPIEANGDQKNGKGRNFFEMPDASSDPAIAIDAQTAATEVDFYIHKIPFGIKLFMDKGDGIKEAPQMQVGLAGSLFQNDGGDNKLRISGEVVTKLSDVWIADGNFMQKNILDLGNNEKVHTYEARQLFDQTDDSAYIDFQSQFRDQFDNITKIMCNANVKGNNMLDQAITANNKDDMFLDAPGTMPLGATNNRTKICCMKSSSNYLRQMPINLKGNFTVSAFIQSSNREGSGGPLFSFEKPSRSLVSGDPTMLKFVINSTNNKFFIRSDGLTQASLNGSSGFSGSFDCSSSLMHFTIVKNRNLIGIWVNKSFVGSCTIKTEDMETLGDSCKFTVYGNDSSSDRIADLVVLHYADSHVPVTDKFDEGTFSFIADDMIIS